MPHQQITVKVPQPPAGTDWVFQPSATDRVQLQSVIAQYFTSAAAGNRISSLTTTNVENDVLAMDITAALIAPNSGGVTYNYRPGNIQVGTYPAGTIVTATCPSFWLPAGSRIRSVTTGLDGADIWGSIVVTYLVEDALMIQDMDMAIRQALGG